MNHIRVGDFVFWGKGNSERNYSVIIVPERGSSTKTFRFSTKLLKISAVLIIILLACLVFLVLKYYLLKRNVIVLNTNTQYIQQLEKSNKAKQERIDTYKKNQGLMQDKLEEIEKLEELIKKKLSRSISFKNIHINSSRHLSSRSSNEISIRDLEVKLVSLNKIDNALDNLLKKEEFIPSVIPCIGRMSSFFGYRKNPFDKNGSDFHPGMDIACSYGTKVYAAASGTIINAGYAGGYGKEVMINHHNGLISLYGHNSRILVHNGQTVKKGDLIALSGSTGHSTGPHLHFEIRRDQRPINPKDFL